MKLKKTQKNHKQYSGIEITLDELFTEYEKQYGNTDKKLPFGMFWAVYRVAGYKII